MPLESKIIKHPRYTEVIGKLLKGDMTLYDASRALHCEYNTLWHHVRHGIQMEAQDKKVIMKPLEPVEDDDYAGMLKNIIRQLNDKVKNVLMTTPERPTALVRELRGCINDLLIIEGRLSQAPIIQLNQITIQFNKLTAELATHLCDSCRQNVLKVIENIESIGTNE